MTDFDKVITGMFSNDYIERIKEYNDNKEADDEQ